MNPPTKMRPQNGTSEAPIVMGCAAIVLAAWVVVGGGLYFLIQKISAPPAPIPIPMTLIVITNATGYPITIQLPSSCVTTQWGGYGYYTYTVTNRP